MKAFRVLPLLIFIVSLTSCQQPAEPVDLRDEVNESTQPPTEPVDQHDELNESTEQPPEEPAPPVGITRTVTSNADSGPDSLREALNLAQTGDTILFDPNFFPPDNPETIFISEALPLIRVNWLTIDASNAGVILDGSNITDEFVIGLQIADGNNNKIMGLQISNFSGPGIGLEGEDHIIGGDRNTGNGPYGQGNLIINNFMGIGIYGLKTKNNIITGNLIGTDAEGTPDLGNHEFGIVISEDAHDNIIGPNNILAYNNWGIFLSSVKAVKNTISQNAIYGHTILNIHLPEEAYSHLVSPVILDFDLAAGMAAGATCANCRVDIFSTSTNGGEIYEGQVAADSSGLFKFEKGSPLTGPFLTAIALDQEGNAGTFSRPFGGEVSTQVIQLDNGNPRIQIQPLWSNEITSNHIGGQFDNFRYPDPETFDIWLTTQGVTRVRVGIEGIECNRVEWEQPEFSVYPEHDEVITRMADNGMDITMVLTFWDKDFYNRMGDVPKLRFTTQAEIDRYLEYVRFTVNHFKDRVEYYEIWNEPELRWWCPQGIDVADYIELVKQTVPVIREEYPEAKIVIGGVADTHYGGYGSSQWYLFQLLESEIIPLVDVVAFHPMYSTSPEYEEFVDYYYGYAEFLQEIKDTAESHGFNGEYHADEVGHAYGNQVVEGQPWEYSEIKANKYTLRVLLMNLGEGVWVSMGSRFFAEPVFNTVIDDMEPEFTPVEVLGIEDKFNSYSFSDPEGNRLIAVWRDGIATEYDPGIETSVTLPELGAGRVVGIDSLFGFEQELDFRIESGHVVIENLLIKDYPILIRLEP